MKRLWHWDYNLIRRVYESLFCVKKNGDTVKTFSTKKFFSTTAVFLAVANHAHLHFDPSNHWVVSLTEQNVDNVIIGTLIGSLDALAVGVKAVYANAKIKGAP